MLIEAAGCGAAVGAADGQGIGRAWADDDDRSLLSPDTGTLELRGGTEVERRRAWERVAKVPGATRRGLGGTGHRPVAAGDPPAARGGAAELQMRRERSGRQVRCQCRSSAAGCHRGRAGGPFHPDQVGGPRGSQVLDAYPHLRSAGADGRWAGRSCRGLAECNSARQSFKPCATSADVRRPTPAGKEGRSGRIFGAPEIVDNRRPRAQARSDS